MSNTSTDRLAVLIDADNAQAALASELMTEVGRYGTATIRRAYGDWTTPNLNGWKELLHTFAIQPIQQFRLTVGKNSTDSALIIDAMDLLHGNRVNGFCLVSSDSDFTRLATRIREAGLSVYGFGEKKTPKPFVAACNKFVFTEILRGAPDQPVSLPAGQESLRSILTRAVSEAAGDDGWAALGAVGNLVSKANPEFDARNYGKKKLGELVNAQEYLEVRKLQSEEGAPINKIYVRIKET
ncbi:MAG TPA: NYN domain-containing protein [Fibrobacteria bacterium]|nr:NYN domain-containing protein [Fibrobacteria bacterium]